MAKIKTETKTRSKTKTKTTTKTMAKTVMNPQLKDRNVHLSAGYESEILVILAMFPRLGWMKHNRYTWQQTRQLAKI